MDTTNADANYFVLVARLYTAIITIQTILQPIQLSIIVV
jgi:hypothetical protein